MICYLENYIWYSNDRLVTQEAILPEWNKLWKSKDNFGTLILNYMVERLQQEWNHGKVLFLVQVEELENLGRVTRR